MTGLFDRHYADTYDLVYRDKDYRREVDAVTRLFARYATGGVHKILDLGCGTGRHAEVLLERGYSVTGIDRSEAMLALARQRLAEKAGADRLSLQRGDARDFSAGATFDAAVMMFNVLGYLTTNDDVLAAFRSVRRHLLPGGCFVFDIWYGPAVVKDPPRARMTQFDTGDSRVTRFVEGRHDRDTQVCDITIRLLQIAGDRVRLDTEETHRVRYFFPLELDLALRLSGFRLIGLHGFPDIDADASAERWGAVAVAAATVPGEGS